MPEPIIVKATHLPKMNLTTLKAFASRKPVYIQLVERFGKRGEAIPAWLRGQRRIMSVHSYGFDVSIAGAEDNRKEGTSRLEIRRSTLCKIEEGWLSIYQSGSRPLNKAETAKMEEWKKIENSADFQRRSMVDAMTDGSSTYWQQKRFFEGEFSYLFSGTKNGKRLSYKDNVPVIYDESTPGEMVLKYRIFTTDEDFNKGMSFVDFVQHACDVAQERSKNSRRNKEIGKNITDWMKKVLLTGESSKAEKLSFSGQELSCLLHEYLDIVKEDSALAWMGSFEKDQQTAADAMSYISTLQKNGGAA